jgi:hypothetical protein
LGTLQIRSDLRNFRSCAFGWVNPLGQSSALGAD